MALDIVLTDFRKLQHALLVACFSLIAIFLVNLYRARQRIIKLRKQGLVRTVSQTQHHVWSEIMS